MVSVSPPSSFAIDVPDALLARARRGDAQAFEQLYRCFERPVYTLALRLTGQPQEAQDILQDTMLKLFDRLSEFRGDAPFWGWLRQVAVNESLMLLRRRGRFLAEDGFEEAAFADQELLLPPRAADAAILGQALARLPGATRSVLWLYHAEGYTHEEIARAMGKTPSFSKSQLARGTRRLRALLHLDLEATTHG
jgi:RNA polymerase sigma-70 factor (ECF subfamily)